MNLFRRSPRVLPLALALAGLTACNNNEEEKILLDEYIAMFTTDICEAIVTCDCEYDHGSAYDHCISTLSVVFESSGELNVVDGLSFDGACAEQALDDLSALGCGVPVYNPDAECETPCKIWYGPMGKGASCQYVNGYDNCKQGLVCGGDGVCVDPCAEPDLPQIGEPCAPELGCDEGAYCDATTDPVYPVCAARPGAGQACAELFGGYVCAEDLLCDDFSDPANPVCVTLPGLGEECLDGSCADGLLCDWMQAPSVCVALPGLGEACLFGQCDPPFDCGVDDVCVDPPPAVCSYYDGLPAIPCADDEYTCGDEACISNTQVCDGNIDCFDGADEDPLLCGGGGCGVDEFECSDSSCIPNTWLCDNVTDCPGGEDEPPLNPSCP